MDESATRIGYPATQQQQQRNVREIVSIGPAHAKHRPPRDEIQHKQQPLKAAWKHQLQHYANRGDDPYQRARQQTNALGDAA
jgi:hypothetical protein